MGPSLSRQRVTLPRVLWLYESVREAVCGGWSPLRRAGADWPSGVQGISFARWAVQYWGHLGPKNAPKCPEIAHVAPGDLGPLWATTSGPNCGLSPPLLYGRSGASLGDNARA